MPVIIRSQVASTVVTAGIQVADLLRRFQNVMMDAKAVRWSETEAIDWINDGATEIVLRRPAARAITLIHPLEQGTLQHAPDRVSQMLDVICNIRPDGLPGAAIRICDRQQLDDIDPNWHGKRAGVTRHYMIDERSPTTFYVYPPAQAGAQIMALGAEPPPAVTDKTDTLDMRSEFISAILNWMMYRAHSKDSQYSQGSTAALHYQAFTDAIGAPSQAAQVNSATGNSK
jgi:hypothetical protein